MTDTLRDWAERHGHNIPSAAWLASDPDEGDYHRREGYRLAGRLLLEHHSQITAANLIYPALAVYRHHYELQLKHLVRVAHKVLETPAPRMRGHDLVRLLPPIEEAVVRAWGDEALTEFQGVRESTEFLTLVDPVGETMRYSLGNRGPTITASTLLDPPTLLIGLESGADLMAAADMGLNAWIDDRNEHLAARYESMGYYEE
ncbi:hypothetical protein FDG2_4178 [Candidatus Protofrankia californiensis]|uniref:Uncharacterized protein n=1 Tax=Candidatus Protofrankia californiensis TaxID=1839754 RepID=A0A1C3P3V2_9ACTN|nr:hypothetical protein FDG2_4178 [Candidatus Protofrankia californiensis]